VEIKPAKKANENAKIKPNQTGSDRGIYDTGFTIYEWRVRAMTLYDPNGFVRITFLRLTEPLAGDIGVRPTDPHSGIAVQKPNESNRIQVNPTCSFTILDLRFTSRGLQAAGRRWFVNFGCRRKRRRRSRFAAAVQDTLRAYQCRRLSAKVEGCPRHKVSAARPDTVAARQCPPPKGKSRRIKKANDFEKIKPNQTGSDCTKCGG